jgi:hypothetical protein
MTAVLLSAILALQAPAFDFADQGPYDSAISSPPQVLGYVPGERHTTFRDQEHYMLGLADQAQDRIKVFQYGKSTEGRPLRVMAISSPANIARLDEIRANILSLSEPGADVKAIAAKTPIIVWVNECIHGNESASFEAAMWTAYTLAASQKREIKDWMNDVVVVLNPVYNADGHERFVVWNNSLAVGSPDGRSPEHDEPAAQSGRVNHYRFDMNRDRVAMSQLESQQEAAEQRKWCPQVYIDQHGQVDTYFFPPTAQSVNVNVDRARYEKWTDVLGRATAKEFDRQGWRYFIRETFDFYGPIYMDTWPSLQGAIGMTQETDGGGFLRYRREDGSMLTLSSGVAKHFTSALAVIGSSAANRQAMIESYGEFRQDSLSGKLAGKFQRVILTSPDPRPLKRLAEQLDHQGIKYGFAAKPFRQRANDYWSDEKKDQEFPAGSMIIDMNQAQGPLAKTLLEPGSDFEKDFTERQLKIRKGLKDPDQYPFRDRPEFYDTTGWSLPYEHDLAAWWSDQRPQVDLRTLEITDRVRPAGSVGWAIPYTDQNDAAAAFEMLDAGVRVHQSMKPMTINGSVVPPGTFFVFTDRNDPGYDDKCRQILKNRGVEAVPIDTSYPGVEVIGPGSEWMNALAKPKLGIVFGRPEDGRGFGAVWFAFEQALKLPFVPLVEASDIGDLSTIILPNGDAPDSPELKEWVQGGGCLILFGGNGSGFFKLERSMAGKEAPASLPGALFPATWNPLSPLAAGYDPSRPVSFPVDGSVYFKPKPSGGSAAQFADKVKPLSGWVWPDETEQALSNTVWAHDERVGRGHVIWFANDPTDRAMHPGLNKMLLNAVLMGRSPQRKD